MTIKITLKKQCYGTETIPELNLLAHAQLLELEVGSECGGHGICGGDRVRVTSQDRSDLSPPTEAEYRHLGRERIEAGWRLACQCYPSLPTAEIEMSRD